MIDANDIPADRNKTDLTHAVTEGAARWLASIGAKCIETEVTVGPKWIADLAAFWSPTPTEATAQKLIVRSRPYPPYGCSPEERDAWRIRDKARLDCFRALPRIITIIVEVKTTRPDHKRDLREGGKFFRPRMADIQIIASPFQLLYESDIPPEWMDLEYVDEGPMLQVRPMTVHPTDPALKLELVAAIAERRHNRTENAMWSALAKRRRSEDR